MGTTFGWVYIAGGFITFIFPFLAYVVLEIAGPRFSPRENDALTGCVVAIAWIFVLGPAMAFVWPIALPLMVRRLIKEINLLASKSSAFAPNIGPDAKSKPPHRSNRSEGCTPDVSSPLRGSNGKEATPSPTEQQLRTDAFPKTFKKSAQQSKIHCRGLTAAQKNCLTGASNVVVAKRSLISIRTRNFPISACIVRHAIKTLWFENAEQVVLDNGTVPLLCKGC